MMTEGDLSARESSVPIAHRLAGQAVVAELLRLQAAEPPRSFLSRSVGRSPLGRESQPWYRAAVAEIAVGEALATLGPDWIVLHAVPVGDGTADIDHVVIGPTGVYIITTTSHPGLAVNASERSFIAGDIRYPFIRDMEHEIGRAERLLAAAAGRPVQVSGVLVVVGARSITVSGSHRDVAVLESGTLTSWLLGQPAALEADEVIEIGIAARSDSTWHTSDEQPSDPRNIRDQFDTLRREVAGAWRTQLVWGIAATSVGAGAFMVITYSILVEALRSFGL